MLPPKLLRAAINKALETRTPLREWMRPDHIEERFPCIKVPACAKLGAGAKFRCWTALRLRNAAAVSCRNCRGKGSTEWERPCYCVLNRVFKESLAHSRSGVDPAFTEALWKLIRNEVGEKGSRVMQLHFLFKYSASSIAKMRASGGSCVRTLLADGRRKTARELALRGLWPIARSTP